MSVNNQSVDFVIITVLEEELNALLKKLPNHHRTTSPQIANSPCYASDFPVKLSDGTSARYHLIVTRTGSGRVEAAITTSEAVQQWNPRYVFVVGVAGGSELRGVELGDVLVPDQIIDYELQKITEEDVTSRDQVYRVDARLLNAAKAINKRNWLRLIESPRPGPGESKFQIGPIASGDKIIASLAESEKLRKRWPALIGVDMESSGVAASISQGSHQAPGLIVIRGVSDLLDGRKLSSDWRTYAAEAAVAFLVELLSEGTISPSDVLRQASGKTESSGDTVHQLPEYDSDSTEGKNLLDIEQDVDAFASLIAARSTTPPLSIGIFGEWGSGKTFFMRKLMQRVGKIASDARRSGRLQKNIAYYKRIVQIEFNAWHYMEGNLWASLERIPF